MNSHNLLQEVRLRRPSLISENYDVPSLLGNIAGDPRNDCHKFLIGKRNLFLHRRRFPLGIVGDDDTAVLHSNVL